jgi:Family of unknown function (DUF6510)
VLHSSRHLDGNAAAGSLVDVFGSDVTDAVLTCRACSFRGALAETRAQLAGGDGRLTCPRCGAVLLRWSLTPLSTWLEMPGLGSLELAVRS